MAATRMLLGVLPLPISGNAERQRGGQAEIPMLPHDVAIRQAQVSKELRGKVRQHAVAELQTLQRERQQPCCDSQLPESEGCTGCARSSRPWHQMDPKDAPPQACQWLLAMWLLGDSLCEAWADMFDIYRSTECMAVKDLVPPHFLLYKAHLQMLDKQTAPIGFAMLKRAGVRLKKVLPLPGSSCCSLLFQRPQTYLQMVGFLLLKAASVELPQLCSLPEEPPICLLRRLYSQPFATAVKAALQVVLRNPAGDMTPFVPNLQSQNTRVFHRLYPTPDTSGSSRKSIVAVVTNIFCDNLDFWKGLGRHLLGFSREAKDHTLDQLQQDVTDVFQEARSTLGEAISSFLLRTTRSILLDLHSKECTDIHSGVEVMLDTWPAAESDGLTDADDQPRLGSSLHGPGSKEQPAAASRVDWCKPKRLDEKSHQCLAFLALNLFRLPRMPPVVQAPLGLGVLQALSLMMSRISQIQGPSSAQPSPRSAFFSLGSAMCVQRRIRSFRTALDLELRDWMYYHLLSSYGACVFQADEMVSGLESHIVQMQLDQHRTVIFADLDACQWQHYRGPLTRASDAGASVRLWRHQLLTLLHYLASTTSLERTRHVLSCVILNSARSLSLRLLHLRPHQAWLGRYAADVCHITTTLWLLSQRLPIIDSTISDDGGVVKIRKELVAYLTLSEEVQQAVEGLCLQLCMQASLLQMPALRFEQLFRSRTEAEAAGRGGGQSESSAHSGANGAASGPSAANGNADEQQDTGSGAAAWQWLPETIQMELMQHVPSTDISTALLPKHKLDSSSQLEMQLPLWDEVFANMLPAGTSADLRAALEGRRELLPLVDGLPVSEEELEDRRIVARLHDEYGSPPAGDAAPALAGTPGPSWQHATEEAAAKQAGEELAPAAQLA